MLAYCVTRRDAATLRSRLASSRASISTPARPPDGRGSRTAPPGSVPWGRFAPPFVFRTTAPRPARHPRWSQASLSRRSRPARELSMTRRAAAAGPGGRVRAAAQACSPARSNLPGDDRRRAAGSATFVAVPPEGVTWRASFADGADARLTRCAARAVVVGDRCPGGAGWQSLPAWLPQDHAVWSVTAAWALAPRLDCARRLHYVNHT